VEEVWGREGGSPSLLRKILSTSLYRVISLSYPMINQSLSEILHLVKVVHPHCVNTWMQVSGKSIEYACPLGCNPVALRTMELSLLEPPVAENEPAESQASDSPPVEIHDDAEDILS